VSGSAGAVAGRHATSRQEPPPPPWLSDRERRQNRDREQRRLAARLAEVFPRWCVMWGTYSRQFWGYPKFRVPRGTIAHAISPDDLAGMMRAIERSARDGRR
jgi:hypothetical protein